MKKYFILLVMLFSFILLTGCGGSTKINVLKTDQIYSSEEKVQGLVIYRLTDEKKDFVGGVVGDEYKEFVAPILSQNNLCSKSCFDKFIIKEFEDKYVLTWKPRYEIYFDEEIIDKTIFPTRTRIYYIPEKPIEHTVELSKEEFIIEFEDLTKKILTFKIYDSETGHWNGYFEVDPKTGEEIWN